ncbi:TPA: MFS transporter [Klebsiella pneumoniae]|nr:MFS transporter [Klebsiella pneumoniae]
MTRFLLCSFALVLLYPSGIDMYLVGLPRIAQDLGASEAQLHIAFSVYLAGMASAMLFAGRIADRSGRKPVAIVGAAIFVIASLLCAQAHTSSHFLIGRFIQGIGAGSCYVVAFAILRETRPTAPPQAASPQHDAGESLLNRFFLSRLLITTLSVTVILTYVNVSPVLMMEEMGFDRGTYSMAMALMAMISMAVSFSTPFALSLFNPRTLMLTSQVLFLAAGVTLSLATRQAVTLIGLGMICAGFSVGFGVAMSQALGPFTLRAGVASSVLGIAQVCGSSLWIWLAAIIGLSAMNMLIGILIACSIVSLVLLLVVTPPRVAQYDEEAAVES